MTSGGYLFLGTKDYLYSYNGKTGEENFEKIPVWKGTFIVFNIYIENESDIDFNKLKNTYLEAKIDIELNDFLNN